MPHSNIYLDSLTPREIAEAYPLARGEIITGNARFDRALAKDSAYVGTGNVFSDVQRSAYIRAHDQTLCNGRSWEPGELQRYDLGKFTRAPAEVRRKAEMMAQHRPVILYEFRMPNNDHGEPIGWIITDSYHRHKETIPARGAAIRGFGPANCSRLLEVLQPHVAWIDGPENSDPVDAGALLEAAWPLDATSARQLVESLGYAFATNEEEARASGLIFQDEAPFSAWRPADPAGSLVRSHHPATTAALVAIRAKLDPAELAERAGIAPPRMAELDAAESGPGM